MISYYQRLRMILLFIETRFKVNKYLFNYLNNIYYYVVNIKLELKIGYFN